MNIVEKLEKHTKEVNSALGHISDTSVRSTAIIELMEMNALCLQAIQHAAQMQKSAEDAMALLEQFSGAGQASSST